MSLLKKRIQAKKMGEQRKVAPAKPLTDKPRIVAGLGIVLDTTKSEEFTAEIDRRISFKSRFAKETKDRQQKLAEMRGEVATAQKEKAAKPAVSISDSESRLRSRADKGNSSQFPIPSEPARARMCAKGKDFGFARSEHPVITKTADMIEASGATRIMADAVLDAYGETAKAMGQSIKTSTPQLDVLQELRRRGWTVRPEKDITPTNFTAYRPDGARAKAATDPVADLPKDVPAAELEEGASVEKEHGATYENIKAYYAEHGEFPPFDTVTEWIATDHLKEFADYYEALEAMEKELKAGQKPEAEAMKAKAAEGGPRFDMKKYKTSTTKTIDDYSDYDGGDASLETSLFEYGLIWKEQGGDYHFIYGVGMDDDGNYNSFDWSDVGKDVRPEEEWSFANFDDVASFVGMTKDDFLKQSIPMIVEVLVSYYGNENVFGSSYHPFKIVDPSKREGVDTEAMKASAAKVVTFQTKNGKEGTVAVSKATNFDYRISKKEAERLLKEFGYDLPFDIMCKEYGPDEDWVGVVEEDLNEDGTLDDDYKTFELNGGNLPPAKAMRTKAYDGNAATIGMWMLKDIAQDYIAGRIKEKDIRGRVVGLANKSGQKLSGPEIDKLVAEIKELKTKAMKAKAISREVIGRVAEEQGFSIADVEAIGDAREEGIDAEGILDEERLSEEGQAKSVEDIIAVIEALEMYDRDENEPAEDDYIIESNGFKLSVSRQNTKFLGEVVEESEAYDMIRKDAKKENWYPNVWYISDHGNVSLVKDFNYDK